MYYYKTVCLESDIKQTFPVSKMVYRCDKWIQDDFMLVYDNNEFVKCLLFNTKIIQNKKSNKSLYGIVIFIEDQDRFNIGDIEQRYLQGGRKLSEIKITNAFKETTPNPEKVQRYRDYYEENGKQSKPILLDYNNVLKDGYIQYLILKENDVEEATIMRKKKYKRLKEYKPTPSYKDTSTIYIFGVHPNSNCIKEFCWRVPASWGDWASNLQIGDTVLCQTKFGFSPVVVNRVEVLDKSPVEMKVKRVAKREIRRNGMVVEGF